MSARNGISVDVRGAERLLRRVRAGGARGVKRCAQMLLAESQRRVPLDTGALSRSGRAAAEGLEARVSYGAPYAVRQHEETGYRHAHGRTAKYLSGPCGDERLRARMLAQLAEDIRAAMR